MEPEAREGRAAHHDLSVPDEAEARDGAGVRSVRRQQGRDRSEAQLLEGLGEDPLEDPAAPPPEPRVQDEREVGVAVLGL